MILIDDIREALKLNDPDYMKTITEIKQRYVSQCVSIESIRELIRKVMHEDSKPATKPEPEAQPVTPEPLQAVQDKRADKELSKRATRSYETEEGMTPSGTKKTGAAGGRSILDMVESKEK